MANRELKLYHVIAMLYIACLIISNTLAVKIVNFGGLYTQAGILVFPLSYLLNDIIQEVYGYNRTKILIWWGFIILAFMSFMYFLAVYLPAAEFWNGQSAFASFFSFVPRIGIASFIAYLIGSFLNSIVMSKMKIWTKGKYLFTRTIGSTIIAEAVDSIVFTLIAFAGVYASNQLLTMTITSFILKTGYEIIATPLTYWAVNFVKRKEGLDTYDNNITYKIF